MTSENFNEFCKLLSDNFILQTYSAYGVMVDFKRLLKDLKSEILTKLQNGNLDKNLYLEYLVNEIDKTDYPKDEVKVNIKKWLDKYKISLESILNEDFLNTPFFKVFEVDTYLQDHPIHFSNEHDEPYYGDAIALQHDFLYYFRWYFTKELLNFIYSFKENFKYEKPTKQIDAAFETGYLEEFCKQLQNINSLHRHSFLQCYDNGILHYTNFLKQEVHKNLVNLPEKKARHYLNFVQTKISNTTFYNTPPDSLHFDILAYDIQDMPFPYRENKELKFYISTCYNARNVDYDHRERMYDLQHKFFMYASMIEAKKIAEFINERLTELNIPVDENNNESIIEKAKKIDNTIFKENGLELLNTIFSYLDINKSNIKKHGNQAKAMSVWDCKESRNIVFKSTILKKDYIEFLNKEYKTKYSTKSMSDGSKYLKSIKECLESIKEN